MTGRPGKMERARDHVFGAMVAGPALGDEQVEEFVGGALQEGGARSEVLAHVAAGENEPVDQFGVLHVRFDEGDTHGAASAWQRAECRHFHQAYNLPKHTPIPKLNRFAGSAVLNFYS